MFTLSCFFLSEYVVTPLHWLVSPFNIYIVYIIYYETQVSSVVTIWLRNSSTEKKAYSSALWFQMLWKQFQNLVSAEIPVAQFFCNSLVQNTKINCLKNCDLVNLSFFLMSLTAISAHSVFHDGFFSLNFLTFYTIISQHILLIFLPINSINFYSINILFTINEHGHKIFY